jgi:hypothetical protein
MTSHRVDREALIAHTRDVIDCIETEVQYAVVFGNVTDNGHDMSSDTDVPHVSVEFKQVPGAKRTHPFRDT